MIATLRLSACIGLLSIAAGCDETAGTSTVEQMTPVPGGPPFIEGSFGASDAAVTACRNLLESQTTGGVTVVGSEFSQANSAVYMRVGANGAPWRCLVSDDGSNPSTMFMGSEGAA
ncbi:hypothetical protein R5H30_21375 [Sulfitobacter sp. D35]|uniref:hypothetical protein n=1 Tax=Sulfitobacter sp. D35 TaxID=3083252 RepID=UPI00296FD1A2|nr:hypothetical protein [Sulfitobacter sp. D35]MDW4500553.1 hypothetical protein [Sulfitobacter sp. D35]